ncbi:MAG: NeuD/PglB/VioB family sugar acetyltransferase, partial [Deltaproteobacteria bacterium]|nr:NeuD/PglB/VioB family sugar acetyltransferase [Deltaproteobacteria bacterium]
AGRLVLGFADGAPALAGTWVMGLPVLATGNADAIALARAEGAEIVLALGDNALRARVLAELDAAGVVAGTVVHPRATISPAATLGAGTVVFAGAVVNPGARIGRNVILNTCASVDHDADIGDHAHLSPRVVLGGTVTVGEGTHLGVGVSVRNNVTIGAWSLVGVGAAVVTDLPGGVVAFGVPARIARAQAT